MNDKIAKMLSDIFKSTFRSSKVTCLHTVASPWLRQHPTTPQHHLTPHPLAPAPGLQGTPIASLWSWLHRAMTATLKLKNMVLLSWASLTPCSRCCLLALAIMKKSHSSVSQDLNTMDLPDDIYLNIICSLFLLFSTEEPILDQIKVISV